MADPATGMPAWTRNGTSFVGPIVAYNARRQLAREQAQQQRPYRRAADQTARRARRRVVSLQKAAKSGNTRSLNSWMAFRSYYLGMFSDVQQKDISAYLTVLWQQDPFHAKWTVLAKAWTAIRDALGKDHLPLDKFFEFIGPIIGIVEKADYLTLLNWALIPTDNGTMTLMQTGPPDLDKIPCGFAGSGSMSVDDVIRWCARRGLVTGIVPFQSHGTLFAGKTKPAKTGKSTSKTSKAKFDFFEAIEEDPRSIAAYLMDLDIDHPFLEISSAEPTEFQQLQMDNILQCMDDEEEKSIPVVEYEPIPPPVVEPEAYWNGSMAELYLPHEPAIMLDQLVSEDNWNSTDLGTPLEINHFLKTVDFDPNFIYPELPINAVDDVQYNFWDSF